ncbi:MAG: hypothetical protein ACREO8_00990 [Luteimonas sp.]
MRLLRVIPLLWIAFALCACASSALITGKPRPPIAPWQVAIYYQPPPGQYEEIALLDTKSGAFTYGEQNKTNAVIDKLRAEAAKLGANGVLFGGTADGGGGSALSVGAGGGRIGGSGFSSGGIGVSISPTQKYAKGIAIYVANPPPMNGPSPPPASDR